MSVRYRAAEVCLPVAAKQMQKWSKARAASEASLTGRTIDVTQYWPLRSMAEDAADAVGAYG